MTRCCCVVNRILAGAFLVIGVALLIETAALGGGEVGFLSGARLRRAGHPALARDESAGKVEDVEFGRPGSSLR